jgi:hypothetical protein
VIRREDEAFINTTNLNILQQIVKQQLSSNQAYCLRTVAAKLMPTTSMPDYAKELVVDLLNYLIKPASEKTTVLIKPNLESVTSDASKASTSKPGVSTPSGASTSTPPPISSSLTPQTQPLISKSGVLRILSELVRSYAGCAKIIAQHVYKSSDFVLAHNVIIHEECNALAFLLDNLLASNQTFGDKVIYFLNAIILFSLRF